MVEEKHEEEPTQEEAVVAEDVTEEDAQTPPTDVEGREDDLPEDAEEAQEAAPELSEIERLELEIARLEAALDEAEQRAAENFAGWQRCQASFDNFRKRADAERQNLRATVKADLLTRLLPVLDDFARAMKNVPEEVENLSWIEGVTLIQRKLQRLLDSEGVTPLEVSPGDDFDPKYHEAIFYYEKEGFEEGQIVEETEQGYVMGTRVLRPSKVVVAKAPLPPAAPEEEEKTPAPQEQEPQDVEEPEKSDNQAQDQE